MKWWTMDCMLDRWLLACDMHSAVLVASSASTAGLQFCSPMICKPTRQGFAQWTLAHGLVCRVRGDGVHARQRDWLTPTGMVASRITNSNQMTHLQQCERAQVKSN